MQSIQPALFRDKSMNISKLVRLGFVAAGIVGLLQVRISAQVVQSADEAVEFPQANLACKVKMGAIAESEKYSPNGTKCDATCQVISSLKGDCGKEISITFRQDGNGRTFLRGFIQAGEVYVILLQGTEPPYRMISAMKAVEDMVAPSFGAKPGDRLLAEMVASCGSKDASARVEAIEQIGLMRDTRATRVVAVAAAEQDAATARAAVIAQYRMGIAPDAKRVMELFDERVLDVWYQESGTPQRDSQGKRIYREGDKLKIMERGVPDFDYATYVREGIKYDWVRKDDHTLYVFFGVPWKVQRKACVPELIKLMDHPDRKVRWWADICLLHTVQDQHEHPSFKQFEADETKELAKWRKWWSE